VETEGASLVLAVALAAGVLAQSIARHLRIPGIILLLAFGTFLGKEGLAWVNVASLGEGLFAIVDFAVAVILFEGGLNLQVSRLRREEQTIRRLITIGPIVTLVGAGLAVFIFLDWPLGLSVLFGSLVVVTGPTVVTPLVREMRLRPKIKTILEAEGVLIDPIGAIIAVLTLEIVISPQVQTVTSGFLQLFFQMGFGLAVGVGGGLLVGRLLRYEKVIPDGYKNIFTLASVILIFQGCEAVMVHSGILAVTVAGVVVGNMKSRVERDLREFKDQLTVLLVGLLFILLAGDVSLAEVKGLGWGGIGSIAALILLVRPLSVFFATQNSDLTIREKVFIAWMAPRGIVAAAVTSLTIVAMESGGMAGGSELRALVFLTIASTVVLAGFTARPLASLLKLRLPRRDRIAILGARGLGLLLGHELKKAGKTVVILDSDPKLCHHAEEAGFQVVFGDALEERTLLRAQIELVGVAVGLTPNTHLNGLFVGQVKSLFKVPKTYIAVDELDEEGKPEYVQRMKADVLFDGAHDMERWDVRYRHQDLVVEFFGFVPPMGKETSEVPSDKADKYRQIKSGEKCVILCICREGAVFPMHVSFRPKNGDVASVALYKPDRESAEQILKDAGWIKTPPPQ